MTLAMDCLELDALLSAEEITWRDTVRAFVRDRIRPNIKDWYEKAVFPVEIVAEMGRLDLLGTHLSGYGCPGRSAVEYGLAALKLEAGDSGLRTFVSVQGSLAMSAIHQFGTEAQKQRWLRGMAAGEIIGCFGRMKDAGTLIPEQISFGKLNNVRTALAIARQARTILGGNGVAMDYSPMRHANNLEGARTYEGTDEMHILIMGRAITGIAAFS
jgi:alkylation response protein AidB-like acyl-CoA dehydrogenase